MAERTFSLDSHGFIFAYADNDNDEGDWFGYLVVDGWTEEGLGVRVLGDGRPRHVTELRIDLWLDERLWGLPANLHSSSPDWSDPVSTGDVIEVEDRRLLRSRSEFTRQVLAADKGGVMRFYFGTERLYLSSRPVNPLGPFKARIVTSAVIDGVPTVYDTGVKDFGRLLPREEERGADGSCGSFTGDTH